jgi:hypothetical protein
MSDLLNSASLVMIPSGYKEDTVYSAVPTNGNGDLSFTRASNGTRINSAGLVEVCPWNLLQYSEDLANGVWTTTSTTITADNTTAPNGTLTADKVEISSSTNARVQQIINSNSITSGLPCTFSVYIKSVSGTGNVGIRSGQTGLSSVFSYTNQWQRFEWTFNAYALSEIMQFCNNTLVGGADSAPSFYAWGAQLNIGSTAKPYFPTTDRLNVPRLTYQNGGGGCPSLLLEKQSTNVLSYSEQFDNVVYDKTGGTVTANSTTSPDGTTNADSFIEDSSTGFHFLQQAFTASAISYTYTVYAKNASGTRKLVLREGVSTGSFGTFDLVNGTVTNSGAGGTASIESVGNGWYRCAMTFTAVAGASTFQIFISNASTFASYTGNGTSGFYLYGAQVEASSYPTSYINTTSASATRVADACFKTGISSLIGQSEGVLFVDLVATNEVTQIVINDTANPSSNIIYIQVQINDNFKVFVTNGGVSQVAIAGGGGPNGRCKIAFAYKQNDFVLYANGTQIGTDTSGTVPACDAFYLGYYNGTFMPLQTNQAVLFPTRLTNAELASLTTL